MPPVFPEFSYPAKVVADGATAYWRLGESSGTTAVDVIGGANGTISGGVTLGQAGALVEADTAMAFNGTTGKIATAAAVVGSAELSVEAWVKTTANMIAVAFVANRMTVSNGMWMVTAVGSNVVAYIYNSGDFVVDSGAVGLNDGVWHHVVWTNNGITGVIYVDGVQRMSAAQARVPLTERINIGYDTFQNTYWDGQIDDVAIYPTALTPAQIAEHYAARTFNGLYRYLHQVKYTYRDATVSYEPVCVQSATESDARNQVLEATKRYANAVGAGRTLTLQLKTSDA